MIWSYSWILHCVSTLYGQMAEVNSLNCTCIKIISASVCFFSFLLLIQQFIGPRHSPFFRLILTFSYCSYDLLREQEIGTGESHITDKADSFHGQIRWEKLNTFAPDSQDVREIWPVRHHVIFVKMIYTLGSCRTFQSDLVLCGLHKFLRLNVADIPRNSFYISLSVGYNCYEFFRMIVSTSDVPVGQLQLRTTVVSYTDAGSMATPFVVPPPPDIEKQCRQL